MKNSQEKSEGKTLLLKEARLQLLRLHKLLVDSERENYENLAGKVSSGQFLNLLINDQNFEWLRKFSTLIVEIDEMLDLDDGFSEDMIQAHLNRMRELLDLKSFDKNFNERYKSHLHSNTQVLEKHGELKKLLSK
jgi:hypothetical protein